MSIADKLTAIAENEQKVYDAGKKAIYDEFWDNIQNYGARTDYQNCFKYWKNEYIRPKYKITPSDSTTQLVGFFNSCSNLKVIESAYFDFSKIVARPTSAYEGPRYMFMECSAMTKLEDIGIPASYYYGTFQNCQKLKTIEVLRVIKETKFTSAFVNCYKLKDLTIEGTIGQNGFDVLRSPELSHDSLMSIINALYDYSEDASDTTYKITLGTSNLERLTADELNMIEEKGWDFV